MTDRVIALATRALWVLFVAALVGAAVACLRMLP
jgi:hypothetical protein